MAKDAGRKVVASNRKARHDYVIEDVFEAGLVLSGTEVKALRMGRASLVDGWCEVTNGEAVARGRAHPRVHAGHLDQPRAAPQAQAAAAPHGDRPPGVQDAGEGADDRPAVPVLPRRPRQGRDRAGPRQERVRQAAGAARAAGQPRGHPAPSARSATCEGPCARLLLALRSRRRADGRSPPPTRRAAGRSRGTTSRPSLAADGVMRVDARLRLRLRRRPRARAVPRPCRRGSTTTTTQDRAFRYTDISASSLDGRARRR